MSDSNTAMKVFKYRLYPSPDQETNLFRVLNCARNLFNMALAERKYAYQLEGRSVQLKDTEKLAKRYRASFPYAQQMFSQTAQSVVKQVDLAYQAFFRRVKDSAIPPKKKGYPRFKSRNRFHSFDFKQFGVGARLDGRRLKLYGIGRVRVRWHRPLEGTIKTVRIVYKAGCWYACFTCEVPDSTPLPATGQVIGIDVGISALITTSDGEKVENPNYYRVAQKKLRVLQRKLARAQRGSNNRRKALLAVQRQQEHVANQRKDYLNKLAHGLVQHYDEIALEDLQITNMTRNHHLSKSILDSGWGYFRDILARKAANAGRRVILVNPAYTSRACSNCGTLFQDFTLSTRWVACACGLSMDRDQNAAINILKRSSFGQNDEAKRSPSAFAHTSGRKLKRASEAHPL